MLYWSLLDADRIGKPLNTSAALLALFECDLPVSIEQIHIILYPCGDRRVLACGIDRGLLADIQAECHSQHSNPRTWLRSLTPDAWPAFLQDAMRHTTLCPSDCNFLVGPLTPAPIRRLANRSARICVLALLLTVMMIAVGIDRRTRQYSESAAHSDQYAQQLITASLGSSARPQDLIAELRRLRQTRGVQIPEIVFDAPLALETLLRTWPQPPMARAESISISADRTVTLVVTGDSLDRVHALADALRPEGWIRLGQAQTNTVRDGVRMTLRWNIPADAPDFAALATRNDPDMVP
ncbi:MAG: hypothetical protein KIT24_09580 [Phycisphaeraceae bacterium]|nr:hypothetical protein [Phycisphaeraceae bacterium]